MHHIEYLMVLKFLDRKTGSKDIRDVLKIAKLCNATNTEQDVNRLISINQKYHKKTVKECN